MSEQAILPEAETAGAESVAPSSEALPSAAPGLARHAFRIGELNLLTPQGTFCEVMELPSIARVPNSASWLLGLANLRGAVVPVFDLARAFGLRTAAPADTRLLVMDEGDKAVAVVIDGLPSLQRFSPQERVPCPEGLPALLRRCAVDCFARAGEHWIEFAHERLFGVLAEDVALR